MVTKGSSCPVKTAGVGCVKGPSSEPFAFFSLRDPQPRVSGRAPVCGDVFFYLFRKWKVSRPLEFIPTVRFSFGVT